MVSKKLDSLQQEVDQITVEEAVTIIEIIGNIHPNDYFLKEITGEFQGIQRSRFLLLRSHLEGELDIQLPVTVIGNENSFLLDVTAVPAIHHNTHIHAVSPADQVIIDDVLPDVVGIILQVIELCVAKNHIGVRQRRKSKHM